MSNGKTTLLGNWSDWLADIPAYTQEQILEQHVEKSGQSFLLYNENAFQLGRHCWADKAFLTLSIQKKQWIAEYWYSTNEDVIQDSVYRDFTSGQPSEEEIKLVTAEYTFEDFWIAFVGCQEKVVTFNFAGFVKVALSRQMPEEALTEDMVASPILQKILAVCYYLSNQKSNVQGTFRISTTQAGEIVGRDSIRGGACLRALKSFGKIKLLELGKPGEKSSLYQYIKQ